MYIAHYNHNQGYASPHSLKAHVNEMLEITQEFDMTFDKFNLVASSVILHDVGKKSKRFQEYVQDPNARRGGVQHAKGGAYALFKEIEQLEIAPQKNLLLELVMNVVAGHHRGLVNHNKEFFDNLTNLPPELKGIEKLVSDEVWEVVSKIDDTPIFHELEQSGEGRFNLYLSTLFRFVMSSLVDADYLSTEAYFSGQMSKMWAYEPLSFDYFQQKLDQYILHSFDTDGAEILDAFKGTVQTQAFQAGKREHTFFTLHAPTGTGKTIAALKFALSHGIACKKSRIITALPLINLTEEMSSLYKELFGEEHVIVDHSGISLQNKDDGPLRLAAENWDRSFIITTTIQLFESLFSERPMKLRKLHRLTNSIIILDEYHKLPQHVLEPIFQQLDILQTHFNVTVLLMSATPYPFFESTAIAEMNLLNEPVEIADYKELNDKLPSRVDYHWLQTAQSLEDITRYLIKEENVLAIVNTRKEAQQLHERLSRKNHPFHHIYHLSTTMCGAHRERIIIEIKQKRFEGAESIAVISTSILEAGVDISFPTVYRMLAPLDAIVQAAGRCNRYGDIEQGQITIFENREQTRFDNSFESGVEQVKHLLNEKGEDIFHSSDSFVNYYRRILSNENLNALDITNANCLDIEDVSKRFRMIEDKAASAIHTAFPGFHKEWLTERKSPAWWRKMQPFMVPVFSSRQYKVINDINVFQGNYDENYGVVLLEGGE